MPKKKYKKRADGRKESTITINGKRYHVYGYTDADIERQKEELICSAHDGSLYIDKVTTFAQWSETWLELIRPNRSINTMKMYSRAVEKLSGIIGDYPLSALRTTDLQIALNRFADEPRTQEILYITLNQIYTKAIAEELLQKNPCANLEKVKYKAPEKRPLTDLEKEAIEKADLRIEDRVYLGLLYYCGLRRGEALALTRSQIDTKHWTLKVDATVVFETASRTMRKTTPKTEAGFRTLPIPKPFRETLKEFLDQLPGLYLITKSDGSLVTHNSYVNMWNRILLAVNTAAGGMNVYNTQKRKMEMQINAVPGLTAHVFRHNYCTMLYYAGIPVKDAQYLMGHANPMTTLNIYTHLDNLKSSSGDLLDKFLAGETQKSDDVLTTKAVKILS